MARDVTAKWLLLELGAVSQRKHSYIKSWDIEGGGVTVYQTRLSGNITITTCAMEKVAGGHVLKLSHTL